MEWWVKQLEQRAEFRLIHGIYNTTADVLENFKARCAAEDIDSWKFSWVGPEAAPDFDLLDPETVVVLNATLDTLQNTFEFAWEWTKDGQEGSWRSDEGVGRSGELRLLLDERPDYTEGDGPDFKPWTLSWKRIKLDTNAGKRPIDVRNPKSPGCALLFMSAEHPKRIKATDYEKRFGFWFPGLKCNALRKHAWQNVPYIIFDRENQNVGLDSDSYDTANNDLSVPSFRE